MILIDTSAWVEFLRRDGQRDLKERVSLFLELNEAAITGPIRFELLSGADKKAERDLLSIFDLCTNLPFNDDTWEAAALYERQLRAKGITVPQDDLFIATLAIQQNLPLFHRDRHFNLIADAGLPLQLIAP